MSSSGPDIQGLCAKLLRASRILRGSTTRSPGPNHPPAGMNPEVLHVWQQILKKYADVIFKSGVYADEWATAIQLLERACAARGLRVFELDCAVA